MNEGHDLTFRKVNEEDFDDVMRIFAEARHAQRAAGFVQWLDGYPSVEVLRGDMESGIGYVVEDGGIVMGYVAITGWDEEYERVADLWGGVGSYAVFHRLAIGDEYRGRGFSRVLFDMAEERARDLGCEYVRIDTGVENRPMQHILLSRGYDNRGVCNFVWGERLAFERML